MPSAMLSSCAIAQKIIELSESGEKAVLLKCEDDMGLKILLHLKEEIAQHLNELGFSIGSRGNSLSFRDRGLFFVPGHLIRVLGETPLEENCVVIHYNPS